MKKDSALGPDGIPYGAYRCAGGLGSQFLFNAYKYLLEGCTVPEHSAESRTVFIPKTSDIDDNGILIRSPDALRPLTLCNCKKRDKTREEKRRRREKREAKRREEKRGHTPQMHTPTQHHMQTSYICHMSRPPLVHHEMHTSFAEMYLFQANDGQHL